MLFRSELYKCYTTDNKIVKLSWSYTNQADGYRIYRYDNGKWSYLKAVRKGSKLTAADKTAKTGKTYQYRILAYKNVKRSESVANGSKIPVAGGKGFRIMFTAVNSKTGIKERITIELR